MNTTTNTGAASLLPCPMCGAAPKLIVGYSPLDHAFVDCDCGMQTALKDTADEVTAMWNRRPTPTPQADAAPLVDGLPPLPAPLEIDWPELHSQALGCGVEDRDIRDRYEAAEYGWQDGVDRAVERVPEEIFTADQMREYALAAIAAGGAQEPTLYQYRTKPTWTGGRWCDWTECSAASAADYRRVPLLHDWAYEVRELFDHAAPLPREAATVALTDEQREALEYAVEMTRRDTSWRSDEYRPVIEALLAAASNGEQ